MKRENGRLGEELSAMSYEFLSQPKSEIAGQRLWAQTVRKNIRFRWFEGNNLCYVLPGYAKIDVAIEYLSIQNYCLTLP